MNRNTQRQVGLARAAALVVIVGWAWLSPSPAQAVDLVVTITSPTSGSTVGGTITVSATVTPLGALVQGVQLKLDGANLGAEETSAPYSIPWDTKTASNGSHTLVAVARDAIGLHFDSDPVTVTVFNDKTPPTVTITSPASGATVTGTIEVTADATDNVGVVGVQFKLDGSNLGAEDTTAPYSVPWNTATAALGSHSLTAVAHDATGNTTTSSAVNVTVPDTTPPTVTITAPSSGATVTGTVIVSANASDNVGVVGVQFKLDGANLGTEGTAAPYAVNWDTATASAGTHNLTAVARDAAGNGTTSSAVSVTVRDTTPPTVTMTAPASGATVSGTITVSANASDNVGVVGVQFKLDGANLGAEDTTAPYSVNWDTATAVNGSSHTLTADGRDAAGNTTTTSAVTVTVSNGPPPDTTPPTVTISAPASGATVSGTTAVSASASDDVGVAGVQFQLDGANLGAEDTTAPYSINWDTTTTADGTHTLKAVARDAAGNTTTSAAVTVTVSNVSPVKGDVFVAIIDGRVLWFRPDGTLRGTLTGVSDGQSSSVAFDGAGNLYVPHWWGHANPNSGNTIARFDPQLNPLGTFGSGYSSSPSTITFDGNGNVYVGQADDSGDILKFDPAGNLVANFNAATVNRGTDHVDLGHDGCTMFYTSRSQDVLRFNVCTNTQLPNFNTQPLPGEAAYHVRVLPDGGVLVADSLWIVRLDASGNQVQTYFLPGENQYWGGLDLVGDGTFWASNAYNADICRFDLASGALVSRFNSGTGLYTAAGVGVKP